MRIRAEDANGNFTFGQGAANYLVDSPEAVALAVKYRLNLWLGEYWLDTTQGMDWQGSVLGIGTVYDPVIQEQILGTQGVQSITAYSSSLSGRTLNLSANLQTIYGVTQLAASFTV